MRYVDINSDLGESFGPYTMGQDEALLRIVSSANVACGFHAGDPLVMDRTVANALASGTGIGAHPGFMDLQGFGRRQIPVDDFVELEKMVVYQIGALMAIARARGHRVTHVKFHGGLAHMAFNSREVAEAVVRAVVSVDPGLILLNMPYTESEGAAQRAGLAVAREIFADRMYDDSGRLRPRKLPGAVIHDPGLAAERVVRMLEDGAVLCASGKRIPTQIDSVCVHGDTPGSVAIAQAVRDAVQKAGFTVRPLHDTIGTSRAAGGA